MSDKKKWTEDLRYWLNMGAVDLRAFDGSRTRIRESVYKLMEAEVLKGFGTVAFADAPDPEPLTLETLRRAMDKLPPRPRPIGMVLVTKLIPAEKIWDVIYMETRYLLINEDDFDKMKSIFTIVRGASYENHVFEDGIYGIPIKRNDELVIDILFFVWQETAKKKGNNILDT